MNISVMHINQYRSILNEYLYITQDDKPAIGIKAIHALLSAYEANRHEVLVMASEQAKPFQANGAVAEISIQHKKDGIEEYDRKIWYEIESDLLNKIKIMFLMGFDIKYGDVIDVSNAGDYVFYKMVERSISYNEEQKKYYITFWLDDLQ